MYNPEKDASPYNVGQGFILMLLCTVAGICAGLSILAIVCSLLGIVALGQGVGEGL